MKGGKKKKSPGSRFPIKDKFSPQQKMKEHINEVVTLAKEHNPTLDVIDPKYQEANTPNMEEVLMSGVR